MKILGISGSPRKKETSGVHELVETVLENTGLEHAPVSLRGKNIGGCIACLGCAKDNICKANDDMADLRGKMVNADAYVIGAPNHYSILNAMPTHSWSDGLSSGIRKETCFGKNWALPSAAWMAGFPRMTSSDFFMYGTERMSESPRR